MRQLHRCGVVLVLGLLLLPTLPTRAEDGEGTREQRTGQLLQNLIKMSSQVAAPPAPLVAKWRRAGSSSHGVGYRTMVTAREGEHMSGYHLGVTYLTPEGLAMSMDDAVTVLRGTRYGTDRATGGGTYVFHGTRGEPNGVMFVMRQGGVQLYLKLDRTGEPVETLFERCEKRWRFLVAEAKRLGILDASTAPQLVVRVWDELQGEWEVLGSGASFARRLADLRLEEDLVMEVEVRSDFLVPDRPYAFQIRTLKGAEFMQLRDTDGQTPLADRDGDGWMDVQVDPVDGGHPPRRLTARFKAQAPEDDASAQKAQIETRFRDSSGEAQQQNGLKRAAIDVVVTHLELRATDLSAQFDKFVTGRLTEEQIAAFRQSRKDPGTWFNGTFGETGDLQYNWNGYDLDTSDLGGGPGGLTYPAFKDRVGVVQGSQADALKPDGAVTMGWARNLASGEDDFLVMEDLHGHPLEIPPLLVKKPMNLYVDVWFVEDLADTLGESTDARRTVEQQIAIREKLEVGVAQGGGKALEASVWLVDDLADLKDAEGVIHAGHAALHRRVQEGLRRPTSERQMRTGGDTYDLFAFQPGDSRSLETYFPLRTRDNAQDPMGLIGQPLPLVHDRRLDLPSGIYELQLRISFRDAQTRDGPNGPYKLDYGHHVAIRFWVLDLPDVLDMELIHREQGRRELRHETPAASTAAALLAARAGDVEKLDAAIRAGADVNAPDENGATPLSWAVSGGHMPVLHKLLSHGADVDYQSPRGQSALNVAASRGDVRMMQVLLKHGAEADERIRGAQAPEHLKGATPLFLAALQKHADAVAELLSCGADVNAVNEGGATALLLAAGRDSADVVRLLLEAGADPGRGDHRGATPLMVAAVEGALESAWLLLDAGADANQATAVLNPGPHAGVTALMAAAQGDQELTALALLLAGAQVDARNYDGKTARDLAEASGSRNVAALLQNPREAKRRAPELLLEPLLDALGDGRSEFVKLLVKHGADVDAPTEKGMPLLIAAADDGDASIVRALLEAGANVDIRDPEYGATAIMEAAFNGNYDVVQLLLKAGADVNLQARGDAKGEAAGLTALMGAAARGDPRVVRALLRHGANRSLVDKEGRTALDMARKARDGEPAKVVSLLETYFPDR